MKSLLNARSHRIGSHSPRPRRDLHVVRARRWNRRHRMPSPGAQADHCESYTNITGTTKTECR